MACVFVWAQSLASVQFSITSVKCAFISAPRALIIAGVFLALVEGVVVGGGGRGGGQKCVITRIMWKRSAIVATFEPRSHWPNAAERSLPGRGGYLSPSPSDHCETYTD